MFQHYLNCDCKKGTLNSYCITLRKVLCTDVPQDGLSPRRNMQHTRKCNINL